MPASTLGVLVDTTICIGCRKCELGCERKNNLSKKPDKYYEDTSVFNNRRVFDPKAYTVVNRYPNPATPAKPTFIKTQCMHCNHAACVSACIVGALTKSPTGAVEYDFGKCIGCRYCMVACPFEVPKYEFDEALMPHVRKCDFCFDRIRRIGGTPACVDACPVSCLIFGNREQLIRFGHKRIAEAPPGRYLDHIYGEHEAGGTSWMYLANMPFESLGLPKVGEKAPPALTENLQHSVFKHWIPPVSLYMILGAAMWIFGRKDENSD